MGEHNVTTSTTRRPHRGPRAPYVHIEPRQPTRMELVDLCKNLEGWARARNTINLRDVERPKGPLVSTPLDDAVAFLRWFTLPRHQQDRLQLHKDCRPNECDYVGHRSYENQVCPKHVHDFKGGPDEWGYFWCTCGTSNNDDAVIKEEVDGRREDNLTQHKVCLPNYCDFVDLECPKHVHDWDVMPLALGGATYCTVCGTEEHPHKDCRPDSCDHNDLECSKHVHKWMLLEVAAADGGIAVYCTRCGSENHTHDWKPMDPPQEVGGKECRSCPARVRGKDE